MALPQFDGRSGDFAIKPDGTVCILEGITKDYPYTLIWRKVGRAPRSEPQGISSRAERYEKFKADKVKL